jgi:transcriptional regulator with XRE-family HTH domain
MEKEELRRRREALGLSQTALAKCIGVGLRTYQEWESGERPIRWGKMLTLALRMIELDAA